jgi:hypothetical protein
MQFDDAAAGKTLQHRIFQQPGAILGGDLLSAELAANKCVASGRSDVHERDRTVVDLY